MKNKTKIGVGIALVLLFAVYSYRIKEINISYIPMTCPFLAISLIGINKEWKSRQLKKVFRYLAPIALTVIALLSLFVVIPVSATITMTHEFYNPLGPTESSSFEYIGSSVLEPPPGWNTTGMRFLSTDLDGNGICDENDLNMFLVSYGTSSGYDFDGNGKSDELDLSIISKTLGKSKNALHGDYSWWTGGPGDTFMTRDVETYCIPALVGAYFVFGFWYYCDTLYAVNGSCRAEVVVDDGAPYTFEGVWTVPVTNNWTAVYVKCFSWASVQSVQVKVHLQNIKAFIDCATVSKYEEDKTEDIYGSLAVGVNIFSYKKDLGMTLDGIVRAVPTLYAEAAPGYNIKWIELKVTYCFHNGIYNLNIPYCAQGNDKGIEVDPGAVEREENDRLFAAGIIIPIVVTGVLTFGVGAIPQVAAAGTMGVFLRFVAGSTFGAAIKFILPHFASDPDHKTADGGSQGDAAWEHWPYTWISINKSDFVNSANAAYDMDFTFDTDSNDWFGVTIEASVCFSEPIYKSYPYPGIYLWTLEDRAIYTKQVTINIHT